MTNIEQAREIAKELEGKLTTIILENIRTTQTGHYAQKQAVDLIIDLRAKLEDI